MQDSTERAHAGRKDKGLGVKWGEAAGREACRTWLVPGG